MPVILAAALLGGCGHAPLSEGVMDDPDWTWAKEDSHRPGMGLRFVDLCEEAAAAIEEWVEREARAELRLSLSRAKTQS